MSRPNPKMLAELKRGRVQEPLARALGLTHVELETPDVARAVTFYEDFGLEVVERSHAHALLRTRDSAAPYALRLDRGPRRRLAGIGLAVGSELELRKLASLPHASPIASAPEPEAGQFVSVLSPGGTRFVAMLGSLRSGHRQRGAMGDARARDCAPRDGTARPAGDTVRLTHGPSVVTGLAHAVLDTPSPDATVLFLMRTFGMLVSDVQHLAGTTDSVTTFMRCDLGGAPADHHTIAVAIAPVESLGHLAFEVADLDQLAMGGRWLQERGYEHAWGIGRHVLGSQVFDYWRAPDGTLVEHCFDGDRLVAETPPGSVAFSAGTLAQWGPRPSAGFAVPPLSASFALTATKNLLGSTEVSVGRLFRAMRALTR